MREIAHYNPHLRVAGGSCGKSKIGKELLQSTHDILLPRSRLQLFIPVHFLSAEENKLHCLQVLSYVWHNSKFLFSK